MTDKELDRVSYRTPGSASVRVIGWSGLLEKLPKIPMVSTSVEVFNFSFGGVLIEPIRFRWTSDSLSTRLGRPAFFICELSNSVELFEAEQKLAEYHSILHKQELSHNSRAAAVTGSLHVSFADFPADFTYAVVESCNMYLEKIVAPMLSFFQRRRILIRTARLMSSERWVYAMPPFLAGEWMDSIAFGPVTITPEDTKGALTSGLARFASATSTERQRIEMLLHRYNELLNLPYVHERVEGLWRMIEALGKPIPVSRAAKDEYDRIRNGKDIPSLYKLLRALLHYGTSYSDQDLMDAREFRNQSTHDYLDPMLLSWPTLVSCFNFLHRCVDEAIAAELSINKSLIKPASFSFIQNRIL